MQEPEEEEELKPIEEEQEPIVQRAPLKNLSEDPEAQEDEDESKAGQVLPCRSIGFTIQLGVRSTPPRKLRLTSNTLCVIMGGNRKKCVFTSEYQILSSKTLYSYLLLYCIEYWHIAKVVIDLIRVNRYINDIVIRCCNAD